MLTFSRLNKGAQAYFKTWQASSSGFFTNQTSKNFDEVVKEKYQQKPDTKSEQNHEQIFEQMRETYEEAFENLEEEESILQSYQKQVFNPITIQEEMENAKRNEFVKGHKDFFAGLTPKELMKRSKEMIEGLRTNQKWGPVAHEKISKDYLDYADIKQAKVVDKPHPANGEEEYNLQKEIFEFVNSLPDNVIQKKEFNDKINHLKQEAQNKGLDKKQIQEMVQKAYYMMGQRQQGDPNIHKRDINWGDTDHRGNKELVVYGRLSPHAKEEIYKLHLEGWSIRDISLRFGILPERVKCVIWMRQYFYDEVLPNVDATTIRLGLEREMMYRIYFPWTDYGLDLEELAKREQGLFFSTYRWGELDARPPPTVQKKMEAIAEKQTKKRYEIVTENFVGENQRGYFVKSWLVNRGPGSNRVNKKFRSIIHHSKTNPSMLSDKTRLKLKEGPRKASFGYGIY